MRRAGLLLLAVVAIVSTVLAVGSSRQASMDSELSAGSPRSTTSTVRIALRPVVEEPSTSTSTTEADRTAAITEATIAPAAPAPNRQRTVASSTTVPPRNEARRPVEAAPTPPPPAAEPRSPDREPAPSPPTPDPLPPSPPFAATASSVSEVDLGASWRPGCPVGPEDLRMVTAIHWGFDGAVRAGRLVVHVDQVDAMTAVLRQLYDAGFPIERMEPIDAFGGDDDASMAANNSSAFNCRPVTGGVSWSEHSYGRAIDVNPVQNPYVRGSTVAPEAGREYRDRRVQRPGMIRAGDAVVRAFREHGYVWGGTWQAWKDYQHFSTTGR